MKEFKFNVVSTGARISSLNADPEFIVYPANGRMRLTKKALNLLGVETGNRLTILMDEENGLIGIIKDDEGKCKVGKNGDFTSASTVQLFDLEGNTSYKEHEVKTYDEVGLEGEGTFLMFKTASAEVAEENEEVTEPEEVTE